jgi:hypothetical protein
MRKRNTTSFGSRGMNYDYGELVNLNCEGKTKYF